MDSSPKKVLVICDHPELYGKFVELIGELGVDENIFVFVTTEIENIEITRGSLALLENLDPDFLASQFGIILSLHCRKILPPNLVKKIKCINIHPGFNPYNRGWYPHVFSLVNGLPAGATLHEMDEEIDHGPIIDQIKVEIYPTDTSKTLYERIQMAEIELLRKNLRSILENNYTTFLPHEEGNVNYKKDFENLCQLDFNNGISFDDFFSRLRALTHPPYKNAYFIDKKSGKKIFVYIDIEDNQL